MRVLVTGGAGFIGSHVVDRLRAHGVPVRIFDLVEPVSREDNDVEYYYGSILDLDVLNTAMIGVETVYHLAAIADVKDVYERPHYAETINVRGTINILEVMRRSGVKRLIYGSTTWVYSETQESHVDESTPLHPPSHLYTVTKVASEYYCRAYANLYGLETTILRYGIPYGPRARPGGVIPIFVQKALKGEPLTIQGNGYQFRRFIYVEDLAEGNALALKPVAKGKIYNLDGPETITIRQIAETIQKILGDVEIQYTEARPGDFAGKVVSSEKARRELSWEPKVSFEEGLRRYIEWLKEHQENKAERCAREDRKLSS